MTIGLLLLLLLLDYYYYYYSVISLLASFACDMSDCISLSGAMTYRGQTHLSYTKEGLPELKKLGALGALLLCTFFHTRNLAYTLQL